MKVKIDWKNETIEVDGDDVMPSTLEGVIDSLVKKYFPERATK